MLSPKKSGTNQRLYRRKDVELVLEIKHLLYDEKYTIEGARAYVQKRKSVARSAHKPVRMPKTQGLLFDPQADWIAQAGTVRSELKSILRLLE